MPPRPGEAACYEQSIKTYRRIEHVEATYNEDGLTVILDGVRRDVSPLETAAAELILRQAPPE